LGESPPLEARSSGALEASDRRLGHGALKRVLGEAYTLDIASVMRHLAVQRLPQVDREKLQLEEEQRLLRCHLKETDPEYEAWETKKFHRKPVVDPISGKTVEYFHYDDLGSATEPNLLELSRTLPDPRGGLGGSGAVPAVVSVTRSIKLSARRAEDFATQDAAAKA
jgi:hypothetical protein